MGLFLLAGVALPLVTIGFTYGAQTDSGAVSCYYIMSVLGPAVWLAGALFVCNRSDTEGRRQRDHLRTLMEGAAAYSVLLLLAMSLSFHYTVTGPTWSWRNYRALNEGEILYEAKLNNPDLGDYEKFHFTNGSLMPGSPRGKPLPAGWWVTECKDGAPWTEQSVVVVVAPIVDPDEYASSNGTMPVVRTWISCTRPCSSSPADLSESYDGILESHDDCFEMWRNFNSPSGFFAWKHTDYITQRFWIANLMKNDIQVDPNSVFLRMGTPEQLNRQKEECSSHFWAIHGSLWGFWVLLTVSAYVIWECLAPKTDPYGEELKDDDEL